MSASDILAVLALIVSCVGIGIAFWANRISVRALKLAEASNATTAEQQFDRIRAELLMQIADSRKQLERTRIEIGALKAGYAAEPQGVQRLMSEYNESLFGDYLSRIEASIRQLDHLWGEVATWTADKPHAELMAVKALLYRTHQDDETACNAATVMMAEYRASLDASRSLVRGPC